MKSVLLIVCGFLSLILGSIGLLLPILPTTPFILLSAACFSYSSPRIYKKLLHSKYFGEFIEHYQNKTGITRLVKIKGIIFLWITLFVSSLIFSSIVVRLILLSVGIGVSLHIVLIKEKIS